MKRIFYLFLIVQSSFGISQVSFNESMEFHNISYNTDFFCSYGDLNNDGYPEILNMSQSTVFHESPRLYWYDNVNGDLNFNSRKVVNPDSVGILNAVLIDIDNDGFLDIFGNVNNQLFWFKNMDGSSFGNRLSIGSHNEIDAYNYFLPFDFNQDGFTDIVVGNDLGKMYVLFNQQNSTLSSPQVLQFANSINLSDARNFKFFDFNNDGHMDLLFNGFFILNDGNNVFFKLINVGQGERKISSINLDNNDYTDFVIYNRANLILRKYFWSNVNNDFYFEDLIIDSFEYLWNNQGNIYLAVGDLDNDGFSDIILPEYATNTSSFSNINYYKNLNNEIFEKKVIKENSYRVSNLLIDDFNNDNRKDILITSYNTSHGNNKITLFSQNEDVTFEEKIIDQPFTPSSTSYFVDVNNDGNTDIINGKNYFKWYENKGNNNWSSSRSIVDLDSENLYDKHYKVTDINNDGLFDIISNEGTINGGNVLKIFKNLGNNDFELSYSLSNEYLNHWHNYHIFQKNNSDFPDIYYLKTIWDHEERDKLFYVRNNNGVFEAPIEMTISPADSFFKAYEIYEMGDLNNDDLPDLILCDYNVANNKYEIIYLENLGNNEFYKHFIADTEALTFHKIVLDDYNSDGNLDIFIFDRGYQKPFKVFENNNLNFIEKIIENEFYLDDLIVYDFNEDGLTDLMTMSYDEFSGTYKMYINYFQNNGSGYDKILIDSHDTAFWGGTPEDRGGFNLFDKNGDGKLDLIITTTDHAEGYIRVLYNTSNLSIINQNVNNKQIIIYPNPFSEYINWKSVNQNSNYQIEIFDLTGKKIFHKNTKDNYLDLSFLTKGIYILKINDELFKIIKK